MELVQLFLLTKVLLTYLPVVAICLLGIVRKLYSTAKEFIIH